MSEARSQLARLPGVSPDALKKLDVFETLLRKWSPAINLVSRETLDTLWNRHFLDSAQLYRLGEVAEGKWVDIGTGGGFPGMVIAILASSDRPGLDVLLVESDTRKAAFLRAVARETQTPVSVIARRIEEVPGLGADVVSARALAPLTKLLGYAHRHLKKGGIALFPKGAQSAVEQAESLEHWRYRCEVFPSLTDPDARVFRISEIERA